MTAQGPESMGVTALAIQQMRDAPSRQAGDARTFPLPLPTAPNSRGWLPTRRGGARAEYRRHPELQRRQQHERQRRGRGDRRFSSIPFRVLPRIRPDPGQRQTLLQKTSILTDRIQLLPTSGSRRVSSAIWNLRRSTPMSTAPIACCRRSPILNAQIARLAGNNPGSAVDFRETSARPGFEEVVSAKLPVEVRTTAAGRVQLYAKDSGGADVLLVDGPAVQGTVAFTGTSITAGSPATALALTAGSIQGTLAARDGGVKTIRDNLNPARAATCQLGQHRV